VEPGKQGGAEWLRTCSRCKILARALACPLGLLSKSCSRRRSEGEGEREALAWPCALAVLASHAHAHPHPSSLLSSSFNGRSFSAFSFYLFVRLSTIASPTSTTSKVLLSYPTTFPADLQLNHESLPPPPILLYSLDIIQILYCGFLLVV
jgi:hypothetical protein